MGNCNSRTFDIITRKVRALKITIDEAIKIARRNNLESVYVDHIKDLRREIERDE